MRVLLVPLLAALASAQNSTEKIRPAPSPLAARAGHAIDWRADVPAALAEARETDRPVFWYVPTIAGSFMDRRPELDRYMLAGPFSWPSTVALLEERFVPVRQEADGALCEAYGLEPIAFVEPGWLVLSPDGKERAREHQLTTFHPARFLAPLAELVGVEASATIGEDAASRAWLEGVARWRARDEEGARAAWKALIEAHPEHPLAAKAAMELEGHGPFVHAFEVYHDLPAPALRPNPAGTQALPGTYGERELRARAAAFLVSAQRASGGWEDSTYDFGGTDGLPNVHVAVSAVCALGLLEHAARLEQPDAGVEAALARALEHLADERNLAQRDTDEILWAQAYRVHCFARWLELRPDDAERVRPPLERAVAALLELQGEGGAWYHEYSNPFVTAEALLALAAARRVGVEQPDVAPAVERGVASLLRCRTEEGAYTYAQARRRARARIEGSVGRTPRCELALTVWAPDESIGLEKAVALSFEHEAHLLPVRKYDDHTRNFGYGGFFYLWDMHARAAAIAALPGGTARREAARRHRERITSCAEFDGAFVDSHELGRSYGTGMALWSLALLDAAEE